MIRIRGEAPTGSRLSSYSSPINDMWYRLSSFSHVKMIVLRTCHSASAKRVRDLAHQVGDLEWPVKSQDDMKWRSQANLITEAPCELHAPAAHTILSPDRANMQVRWGPTDLHATTRHPAAIKTLAVPDDSAVIVVREVGGMTRAPREASYLMIQSFACRLTLERYFDIFT
jgi:hypothetical protein